jgi:hypothetical protein
VDECIGHMAHVASLGRYLRRGLDVRRRVARYDGQTFRCEDCPRTGPGCAGGQGAEAVGRRIGGVSPFGGRRGRVIKASVSDGGYDTLGGMAAIGAWQVRPETTA